MVDAWTRRNGSGLVWAVVIDLVVVDVSGGGRTLRTVVKVKVRKKEEIEKHTLLGLSPFRRRWLLRIVVTGRHHCFVMVVPGYR